MARLPNPTFLRASLEIWEGRAGTRKKLHTRAQADLTRARARDLHPRQHLVDRRDLRSAQLKQARANVQLRQRQLAEHTGAKPRIITAGQLGLSFQSVFGSTGRIARTFGHYTAGPRAASATQLAATARAVHAQHRGQGWGGCSYSIMIADDGTLCLLNPPSRKAAGVAGQNTGSVHLNCPGTTGHKPTAAQEATLEWYVANAHTSKVPKAYRSPVDLRKAQGLVHSDRNATACPGDFTPMYRRVL